MCIIISMKQFGLRCLLAVCSIVGISIGISLTQATTTSAVAPYSWSQYCATFNNYGSCSNTQSRNWYNLFTTNDTALAFNNASNTGCSLPLCSSSWFSTSDTRLSSTPDQTIKVPVDLPNNAWLTVYMYSVARNNARVTYRTGETAELFVDSVASWNGQKAVYPGKVTGVDASGMPTGTKNTTYSDAPNMSSVGNGTMGGVNVRAVCGTRGTVLPMKTYPTVAVRQSMTGSSYQLYTGSSGSLPQPTPISFRVGWLRQEMARTGGSMSRANAFIGVFYTVGGAAGSTVGCIPILLNANIVPVPGSGKPNLYPDLSIKGVANSSAVGSDTPGVTSSVKNDSSSIYSGQTTNYGVYDFRVKNVNSSAIASQFPSNSKGTNIFAFTGGNNIQNLCNSISSALGGAVDGFSGCTSNGKKGSNGASAYAAGATKNLDTSALQANSLKAGDIICRVVAIDNFNYDNLGNNKFRMTAPVCFVVSKTPKLSITGGDVRTLSDADTSQNSVAGKFYGSWVEYGAFADGTNQHGHFGSGATLRPIAGQGVPSLSAAATNPLTFANATLSPRGSGPYGSFGGAGVQTTLADSLTTLLPKAGSVAGSRDLGSLASGRYDATSALTLHGTVGSGKSIVINAKGQTVAIDGNIAYSGTASAPNDIPQVVIIAKSIVIKDSVDTVSAWLLADTSSSAGVNFVTCDIGGAIAATTLKIGAACDKKRLTINGPATANKAHFYRTAGASDKDHQGETSESFNLPSNTYIWQYQQAAQSVAPTTVQVTQLPPRY